MSSINKVQLIGRLGADPEVKHMPNSGDAVCNVSLATSETWKDKASGEKKEATEWHSLVFFGRVAEVVGEYARKGGLIYVEGKLKTRKWQDKDSGQDRYKTEIHCHEMKLLGSKQDGDSGSRDANNGGSQQRSAAQQSQTQQPQRRAPLKQDTESDIPF